MKITIEKIGDVTADTIPGDSLDASNAKEFKCDIAPILEDNGNVLLDMSSLQFVDSSGLAHLPQLRPVIFVFPGELEDFRRFSPLHFRSTLVCWARVGRVSAAGLRGVLRGG